MSDKPEDDAKLGELIHRALHESGDLVPTAEGEVERAEASLDDNLEIPERLQSYRPRREAIPSAPKPPSRRRRFSTHAAAAALGALAASAVVYLTRPTRLVTVSGAGGDFVQGAANPSSSAPPRVASISFQSSCVRECCSGTDCPSAPPELKSCPSGIRCAPCTQDNANGGPFRLRLGSVIPSDAGRKVLPAGRSLDLCVVSSSGETTCVPAFGEPGNDTLRLLRTVTPMQDLLLGLHVELRKHGESAALASWSRVATPTPQVMCKGLVISFTNGPETLGHVSAFIELTHFVELARSRTVPDLLKTLDRLDVTGIDPRIYETSQPDALRFALVLGPLDKRDADALRWTALDHGFEADVVLGSDFVGSPRPAR